MVLCVTLPGRSGPPLGGGIHGLLGVLVLVVVPAQPQVGVRALVLVLAAHAAATPVPHWNRLRRVRA